MPRPSTPARSPRSRPCEHPPAVQPPGGGAGTVRHDPGSRRHRCPGPGRRGPRPQRCGRGQLLSRRRARTAGPGVMVVPSPRAGSTRTTCPLTQGAHMSDDEKVAKDLVETLKDGERGFASCRREAAGQRPSRSGPRTLQRLSEQRAGFRREIVALGHAYGDDVDESGSAVAALHRGWISLKDALTGDDAGSVLGAAVTGEDHAVSEYEKALEQRPQRRIPGGRGSAARREWWPPATRSRPSRSPTDLARTAAAADLAPSLTPWDDQHPSTGHLRGGVSPVATARQNRCQLLRSQRCRIRLSPFVG